MLNSGEESTNSTNICQTNATLDSYGSCRRIRGAVDTNSVFWLRYSLSEPSLLNVVRVLYKSKAEAMAQNKR